MSSERSPLLSGKRIDTPRYNDEDSDGYDSDGHITILTSNPPSSRGSIDSTALIPHIQLEDEGEALVKKRLDGAPLITVLFGLVVHTKSIE
jgi:hypothetical protein